MIEPSELEARLRESFPTAERVSLEDLTGSKDHYAALLVDEGFAGLSRIEQHQRVYRALGALMHGPIHALTLRTYTPDVWAKLPPEQR